MFVILGEPQSLNHSVLKETTRSSSRCNFFKGDFSIGKLNGMTFLHPDHQAPKNCSIVVKIEYNKNKLPPFGGMDNKILGSEKVPGSEGFLFVVNFLPTLNCVRSNTTLNSKEVDGLNTAVRTNWNVDFSTLSEGVESIVLAKKVDIQITDSKSLFVGLQPLLSRVDGFVAKKFYGSTKFKANVEVRVDPAKHLDVRFK